MLKTRRMGTFVQLGRYIYIGKSLPQTIACTFYYYLTKNAITSDRHRRVSKDNLLKAALKDKLWYLETSILHNNFKFFQSVNTAETPYKRFNRRNMPCLQISGNWLGVGEKVKTAS